MSDRIGGLWVAMATPLNDDGSVDHAALARHANWLLAQGCDGLVLFGTTGEGTSFSTGERLAAIEALQRAGVPSAQIALAAGFPSISDSIALTRQALSLGLTHVLLLPPYFYRDAPHEGIEDAFTSILDCVADDRLRVTLYHIPHVSGVAIAPQVVSRLRARYGRILAGVKDSSGNFSHFRAFRVAAPDVAVTVGNEVDIGRALAEGGTGTICGMGNLVPQLVRAMFTDSTAEPTMRAATELVPQPFLPGLKATLAALTGQQSWTRVRPPMRPADAALGIAAVEALRGLETRDAA
jgi:4-hydroxy-tetrahydrodipicolinate synthase